MIENGVIITLDKTEEFLKSIRALAQTQVMVGIPSSTAGRRGVPVSNATLGYIHEYGSPANNIPARPFLFPTINRMRDQAVSMLKKAAQFNMDHKPAEAMNTLNALGLLAATAVKNNVVAGGDPTFAPLAPATIRRRMSKTPGLTPSGIKPLIDTAQMLNAITYVLRKKK